MGLFGLDIKGLQETFGRRLEEATTAANDLKRTQETTNRLLKDQIEATERLTTAIEKLAKKQQRSE